MYFKLSILSDKYKSERLLRELNSLSKNVSFDVVSSESNNRQLDPTIVVALVAASATAISSIFAAIITNLTRVHEKEVDKDLAYIEIKKRDGSSLKIPCHLVSEEEIRKTIEGFEIASFDDVEYVAHLED